MAAVLLCLHFHLPAAAWHVPARSAPHAASGPYAGIPQLAPAAPHGCSQGWRCQPVCALLPPLTQPCCQGQPRGCQSGDLHAPRAPSSFSRSNPAGVWWVSLSRPFSCSTFTLLPVFSRFPSLPPPARCPDVFSQAGLQPMPPLPLPGCLSCSPFPLLTALLTAWDYFSFSPCLVAFGSQGP